MGGPTNGDVTVETDEGIFEEGSDLLGKRSSEMPLKVDMGTKKTGFILDAAKHGCGQEVNISCTPKVNPTLATKDISRCPVRTQTPSIEGCSTGLQRFYQVPRIRRKVE